MFIAINERLREREEGFTLIELLVVVIIIGILAAIAIPTFLNQRQRAWRSAMQTDLRNLAVEMETYFTDGQTYAGFAIPAGFRTSAGVALTVPAGAQNTATTYCLQATHANIPGVTWSLDSDRAIPLDDVAC